jgi:hypothetical protein
MKTKIFISLFILYFLGACKFPDMSNVKHKADTYTNVTFRIKGTITDSTNNSPVVGAWVDLVELGILGDNIIASAKTNNEGYYTIDYTYAWDLVSGPVSDSYLALEIVATGYKTKYIKNNDINHVRITEEWQIIDVQLEPGSDSYRFSR